MRSPTGSDLRDVLSDSQLNESQSITFRNKRKYPEENEDMTVIKKEVSELSNKMSQVMTMLTTICTNQNELMEKLSLDVAALKEQINNIKTSVDHISTEHKTLKSDICNLQNKNKGLEDKIVNFETEIINLKSTSAPSSSLETERIVSELNEREQRRKNIIIVGIPESIALDKEERIKTQKDEVMNILKKVHSTCPEPRKIIRLGKYTLGKHRPVKIFFDSQETTKHILKNKMQLKDEKLRIYTDQTPQQKTYLNKVTQDLKSRMEKGEDGITIKYVNNVPKIVKAIPKNLNQ